MSISERYRDLAAAVERFHRELPDELTASAGRVVTTLEKAAGQLGELKERVGEIPRIRLEHELSPVLLRVHGTLDRARLLLEEAGEAERAAAVWELEQQVYRLLNSL